MNINSNIKSKHLPGRDPVKRAEIVNFVIDSIISGELKPGDRLPNREWFIKKFQVAMNTLQGAVEHLIEHGFITSERGAGTFVAQKPPCTHRFAMIFSEDDGENIFSQKLLAAGKKQAQSAGYEIVSFKLDYTIIMEDESRLQTVIEQIDNRLFAGILILPIFPKNLIPVHAKQAKIPLIRFYVDKKYKNTLPAVADIFFELSVAERIRSVSDYLTRHQLKRLGIICWSIFTPPAAELAELAKKSGVEVRDIWFHALPKEPQAAFNAVKLLLSLPEEMRPDCLYVDDDNLIETVAGAVTASGLTAPGQISIICAYNFPVHRQYDVAICKIGVDTNDIVRSFFDCSQKFASNQLHDKIIKFPIREE